MTVGAIPSTSGPLAPTPLIEVPESMYPGHPGVAFGNRLVQLCKAAGWRDLTVESSPVAMSNYFEVRCKHGMPQTGQVTDLAIASKDPVAVAEALFGQWRYECENHGAPVGSVAEFKKLYDEVVAKWVSIGPAAAVLAGNGVTDDTSAAQAAINEGSLVDADIYAALTESYKNLILYGSATYGAGGILSPGSTTISETSVVAQLAELVPALKSETAPCPASRTTYYFFDPPSGATGPCPSSGAIASMIIHLNDIHRWTREQIADWLDTLPIDLTLQPASTGD